jgi:hypothetical protein
MSVTEHFKYIVPMTVAVEKDPDTGFEFVYCKITNPYIREANSAHLAYIEKKNEFYNPDDPTDRDEMEVSQQIAAEIHGVWKLLNPS